jgi:hypothetical protein
MAQANHTSGEENSPRLSAKNPDSSRYGGSMRMTIFLLRGLAFWDAMLWAAAQRAGVRHLLTEDLQDGFELAGVRFVNPFDAANNRLIDEILPLG